MSESDNHDILIKKIQFHVYEILCYIDDFCKEHGITYYLSGGSCLGAVRHKGFIPWDDDADVMMPRPDYERFIHLFKEHHNTRYEISALRYGGTCKHVKIWDTTVRVKLNYMDIDDIGILVDVFPIDGLPENKLIRKYHYKYTKILAGLASSSVRTQFLPDEGYRIVKRISAFFTKRIGPRPFVKKMDKSAKKYPFMTSKYVGAIMAAHYGEKETIRRECMERAVYLPFENRKFPVPIGYKKYLSNLYGDYMKIPEDADAKASHIDGWDIIFLNEKDD